MKTKEEILEAEYQKAYEATQPGWILYGHQEPFILQAMEEYANQKTEALNDLYQTSLAKYLEATTEIKSLRERIRDLENRIIDYKERWLTKGV